MRDEIGGVEVGSIQEIEDLRSELEVQVFVYVRLFQHGEIPGSQARPNVGVSPDISKKAAVVRLRYEGVWIEPLTWISEHHRACESGIEKRSNRITRIPAVRSVVTKLGSEWKPGLGGHDAIQRPSASQMICNAS